MFAADFRDRVVHHLLVSHQERVFEPIFIHDSFACRKGKGTLAASNRLMEFLRRVTANGHRGAWGLKLDVASFFASIHKQTLYRLIAERMQHPELLWLTQTVLFHDPTTDYRFRSAAAIARREGARRGRPGTAWYPVPAQKSQPEDTRTQRQQAVPLAAAPLIPAPSRKWCERSSTDVASATDKPPVARPAQPLRNG